MGKMITWIVQNNNLPNAECQMQTWTLHTSLSSLIQCENKWFDRDVSLLAKIMLFCCVCFFPLLFPNSFVVWIIRWVFLCSQKYSKSVAWYFNENIKHSPCKILVDSARPSAITKKTRIKRIIKIYEDLKTLKFTVLSIWNKCT